MTTPSRESTFRSALQRLQAGPTTVPWLERRRLARDVGEALAAGLLSDTALALAHSLAHDPKWEVRGTVAESLTAVPESDFEPLAAHLAADSNTFVRRAAERAVDLRRQQQRAWGRTRRTADQVNHQLQSLEDAHGKQALATARRVCERYGEVLVGSLVHDLRSILTHLQLNCLALIDEAAAARPAGRRSRAASRVRSDLEFLERSLSDMATFTQPLALQSRPERLLEIVTEANHLARDNVRQGGLEPESVTVSLEVPGSVTVEVSRHLLVIAVANVLKNAYEAFTVGNGTLRAGKIVVRASVAGSQVALTVRDDGMGIAPEEREGPLLYVPGRRNKSKRQSTGYGLPIAARNLAAHDGSLFIESQEDAGTTVTMTLPLSI